MPPRAGRAAVITVVLAVLIGFATFGALRAAPPPRPSTQASAPATAEADGDVPGACGRERWAVKTGTDGRAATVSTGQATDTTIGALRAIPAPTEEELSTHGFDRIAPVELTVYRVHARLLEYRRETDSDYHAVLADASGATMIVEIPIPSCVGSTSPFRGAIVAARSAFDSAYPGAERQTAFATANRAVTVTGVGFFDFLHGQTGVAPNAIELHPVLAIAFE